MTANTAISIPELCEKEVAAALVKEAQPGYSSDYHGRHYLDLESGVIYHWQRSQFKPWSDNAQVVWVGFLLEEGYVIEDEMERAVYVDMLPWEEMVDAYLESQGEEREESGHTPGWVEDQEVIGYCSSLPQFQEKIEEGKKLYWDEVRADVEVNIVDSIDSNLLGAA